MGVLCIPGKQLEEADLVALNKCDLLGEEARMRLEAALADHPSPARLREIIERAPSAAAPGLVNATFERLDHFSPARPEPVHRYDRVE